MSNIRIDVETHCDGFRLTAIDSTGSEVTTFVSQEEDMGFQVYEFLKELKLHGVFEESY